MRAVVALLLLLVFTGNVVVAEETLFDRLGGKNGIDQIVSRTLDLSIADPRIASTFGNTNMQRLKKLLAEQLCELTGGPCKYTGRDMQKSHAHLKIQNFHFNALVENLQAALDEANIGYATQNELLAILAPMQRDVTAVPPPTR